MKHILITLLLITVCRLSFSQDIDFEKNVHLRGTNEFIHDGILWIGDSIGGGEKLNFMFTEVDTFKLVNNLLNELHFLKHASIRLHNIYVGSQPIFKSDGLYDTKFSTLSFREPPVQSPFPGNFILATDELSSEGSGITGNGATVTIWSPGDEIRQNTGIFANLVVLDEDLFEDGDTNPYNNNSIVAYLNPAGVWTVSDNKRKENIQEINESLEIINQLKSYNYNYKLSDKEKSKKHKSIKASGLMAQEVITLIPEAVNRTSDDEYFVNYSMITPYLVRAIQEQQEIITSLQEINQQLENNQLLIENRLKSLESISTNSSLASKNNE